MENDINAGGKIAITQVRDRRAQSEKMLASIFGKFIAASILCDKKLLPLLLPVLHSDGKDQSAVAALRRAIFAPPGLPKTRRDASTSKRSQSDCSETFLMFA